MIRFKTSILYKLIFYMLSIVLTSLLVVNIIATQITNNEIKKQFINSQNHILDQNKEYIDSVIKTTNHYVNQLTADEYFYNFLLNEIEDYPTYYKSIQEARKRLDTIVLSNEIIESIQMIIPEGVSLSCPPTEGMNLNGISKELVQQVMSMPFYKKAVEFNDKHLFLPPHRNIITHNKDKLIITNVKSLKFVFANNKTAVVMIHIKPEFIQDILRKSNNDGNNSMFIVDGEGNIVSHLDSAILGKNIKDKPYIKKILESDTGQFTYKEEKTKENMFSIHTSSKLTGWKYITVVPEKDLTSAARKITRSILAISIACFSVTIIIAFVVSLSISRPINAIVKAMAQVEGGNLNAEVLSESKDELGRLSNSFNHMVEKINKLIDEEYKAKLLVNKIKLELLQMQINPHLLYNTLAFISYTAKEEGNSKIVEITENLSNFYKGILSKGRTVTTFKQEIEMVSIYMNLTKSVYGIDVDMILDIDKEVLDLYTIKLLLQPMVENAVIHGMKPKKSGTIIVSMEIEGEKVSVLISDDGIGVDSSVIEELNNINLHKRTDKGYAISNIIKRMKLFFGEEYEFEIRSNMGEGTNIHMKLPIITENGLDYISKKI